MRRGVLGLLSFLNHSGVAVSGTVDEWVQREDQTEELEDLLRYLQKQAKKPPEEETVLSWVARGEMKLMDALDLVALLQQRKGLVLGYHGFNPVYALGQVMAERGVLLAFDPDLALYSLFEAVSREQIGFRFRYSDVPSNLYGIVKVEQAEQVLLGHWDRTPTAFAALEEVVENWVNVVYRMDGGPDKELTAFPFLKRQKEYWELVKKADGTITLTQQVVGAP